MKLFKIITSMLAVMLAFNAQSAVDSTLTESATSKSLLNDINANEITSNMQYITNNLANAESNTVNTIVNGVYNPITGQDITNTHLKGYEDKIGKKIFAKCLTDLNNPQQVGEEQYNIEAFVDDYGRPNIQIYRINIRKSSQWIIGEFYGITPNGLSNPECNVTRTTYKVGNKTSYYDTPQAVKWQ